MSDVYMRYTVNEYHQKSIIYFCMTSAITRVKQYFIDAYAELKKVSWPTKKQTVNYTVLVVAMTVGVAVFFAVLDYVFNLGLGYLI